MFMFYKMCFVSWFIIFESWGFGLPTILAQQSLPDDEVLTLQQILVTMGAEAGRWNLDHPCKPSNTLNITCSNCKDGFCHVTELRLKELDLPGTLPPELVNLTYLEKVDFTRNFLHGSLPPIWSTMKHLNFISLTANRLTGKIPKEWGNFPSLTYLSFEANKFSGSVPEELGNLVNLTHLFFCSNKFVGSLPKTLVKLKNLQYLRLSDNSFEGPIPEFIGNLTQLRKLEMYATGLEGPIPTAIFHNLENLENLRITDMAGMKSDFTSLRSNMTNLKLVLRNVNLSGTIPREIWDMLPRTEMLDLSFNNLEGELYAKTNTAKHTLLTGNKLNGSVPDSFRNNSMVHNIDLSYNNFTWSDVTCSSLENVNTYRSSSLKDKNGLLPCLDKPKCQQYRQSFLHINCGGPSVMVTNANGSLSYEGDEQYDEYGSAKSAFVGKYWGFSSTGYLAEYEKKNSYIVRKEEQFGDSEQLLHSTARKSPLSLTYFGCLENGTYTVNLHFAELEFGAFSHVGRRIFDIYIQGERLSKDFNLQDETNGTANKAVVKQYFNVSVIDNTLDIRFYWAGKGTTVVPQRGHYGILISAISVCPSSKSHCEVAEPKNPSRTPIMAGAITSILCLIFLVMGFITWRRCRQNKYTRQRSGLELLTGSFTLRQLRAATDDFDSKNKIGEGGFGSVYKGQLSDGTIIAVKQLSSKSRQGNREFVTEIGMISALQHPNLVKLYGCCIEGDQLLLVYEYMENNCLAHALFGSGMSTLQLDWAKRFNICVGIAKGLLFLHEGSPLKVVHRDIKATNVLLDSNYNAKISDFGLAKLREEENSHISTRIAGTIGYMAPEYALWGYLTEKADVYSFGIVLLEIVSGKSNANYRPQNQCVCLLDYTFVLQQKGKLLKIMDPNLGSEFNKEEAEKVIKVALLCTNASSALRPTMAEVISMLEGQTIIQEVVSDPGIYGDDLANDLRFKTLKAHFQQIQDKRAIETQGSSSFNPKLSKRSTNTSGSDLYEIDTESLPFSSHDLS